MKKTLASLLLIFGVVLVSAQVGINTKTPKVTLQVEGSPSEKNIADGILAPKISRSQLAEKLSDTYSSNHEGTVVYVTDINFYSGTTLSCLLQTQNINLFG